MILIYILIVLFVCLIGYQIFLAISPKSMIEGMENEETGTTDTTGTTGTTDITDTTGTTDTNFIPYEGGNSAEKALSLATQNQYNIEYLNQKVKDVDKVKDDIAKMKLDLDNQQQQIGDISGQMGNLGHDITGGVTQEDTMNIQGLDDDDPTAVAEANIAATDNTTP
jgi:NADH:ubiquinone oxidoreductase subunit 3 (subunit A)